MLSHAASQIGYNIMEYIFLVLISRLEHSLFHILLGSFETFEIEINYQ